MFGEPFKGRSESLHLPFFISVLDMISVRLKKGKVVAGRGQGHVWDSFHAVPTPLPAERRVVPG